MIEFLELAYKYYPKGLTDNDRFNFFNSIEYKRHTKRKEDRINELRMSWYKIIENLNQNSLDESYVVSFDFFLNSFENSFPVAIYFPMNSANQIVKKNLVLHISVLIDYFLIYQAEPLLYLNRNFSYDIDPALENEYLQIKSIVLQHLPFFREFPKEMLNVEISDIGWMGLGKIPGYVHPTLVEPLTLYNLFFSPKHYCHFSAK